MVDDKKFCFGCGVCIKDSLYNRVVYPVDEFKEGVACFGCAKRIREKNMKEKGIKKGGD